MTGFHRNIPRGRRPFVGSKALALLVLVIAVAWRPALGIAPSDMDIPTASDTHPTVPPDAAWAGAMVIGILGFFFAAVVIGLVIRAHAPEAGTETHSHDEPPGASHHHGRSGTVGPQT